MAKTALCVPLPYIPTPFYSFKVQTGRKKRWYLSNILNHKKFLLAQHFAKMMDTCGGEGFISPFLGLDFEA